MKGAAFGRPTASLFVQLLTFTGLTLVAAHLISLALIFYVPPPTPDFYWLSEVEQAYLGAPHRFAERRPLEIRRVDRPPAADLEGRPAERIRAKLSRDLHIAPDRIVVETQTNRFTDRRVFRILRERIAREGDRGEPFLVDPFQVAIQQPDGRWILIRPQPRFGLAPWQRMLGLWFVLTALAMAPLAYVFARRLSAPIRLFADAAERLGRDPRAPPLAAKGPAEIRGAVLAFNEMQERLRRYVEDRTAMVSAIAHDLRTPLTRLRFRIEAVPDEQRDKMAADMDQMEEMISAALSFVRDASRPGERTPLELSSLLESLCDEMAETGASTHMEPGEKVVVEGDPMALRRMFSNLLDNAVKFGRQARARVYRRDADAVIEIDDEGPGIPAQDMEKVFEPFYRREPSRSRKTGGTGLGLAVVRSVARGHGGDVELINRDGAGLTARVVLPL